MKLWYLPFCLAWAIAPLATAAPETGALSPDSSASPARPVDAATRAIALKVVRAISPPENFHAIVPVIFGPILKQMLAARGAPQDAAQQITGIVLQELNNADLDGLYALIAESYARRFSASELTDIATFYDTPAGRHLVAAQADMAAENAAAGRFWAQTELAPLVQRRVEALMKERNKQNP